MRRSTRGLVQAALAAQLAVEIHVGVLADAGAVVHQADHADQRMIRHRIEQVQHVGRRDFAAQMQEVVRLQQPGLGQGVQIDDAVVEGLDALLVEAEVAQAERVQHRGDAGGGALRVVRHHGGAGRPARQAARLHLAFQVVGVDIDDAGDEVVAVQVDRAGRMRAARAGCRRSSGRACTMVPISVSSGRTRIGVGQYRSPGSCGVLVRESW